MKLLLSLLFLALATSTLAAKPFKHEDRKFLQRLAVCFNVLFALTPQPQPVCDAQERESSTHPNFHSLLISCARQCGMETSELCISACSKELRVSEGNLQSFPFILISPQVVRT